MSLAFLRVRNPPGGVLLLVALLSGCRARPPLPPGPNQPHARLTLRRSYESLSGTHIGESLRVGPHAYASTAPRDAAAVPRNDVILIHPTPAGIKVRSTFFHYETRLVDETYDVEVPYLASQSFPCGAGAMCTTALTQVSHQTATRKAYRPVEVPDAACAGTVWISPKVGGEYFVSYDYAENSVCHLACFEQVRTDAPDGFQNRPCPEPTPAEMQKLLEEKGRSN